MLIAICVTFSACVSPRVALGPVSYEGHASTSSPRRAEVRVLHGESSSQKSTMLLVGGGAILPIPLGGDPAFQFGVEDQLRFAQSFGSELRRLEIFRSVETIEVARDSDRPIDPDTVSQDPPAIIHLNFISTRASSQYARYWLEVEMRISGKKGFIRTYNIDSSSNDSLWQRMNTRAAQGKKKAAQLLLIKLIPDVETWIKENEPDTQRVGNGEAP
jgi:hypothetical protein